MALILVLVLQRITVTRSLRPLERARQQIAQLQQGQRSQLDEEVPSELAPLVGQVNHLLSHTEDSLRRSRNALGNLGHALKTPLAVLLSLASSERLKDLPEVRAQMREQLEQIQQRLARELNRARLAGDALPGAQFDCDAELPGLLGTLGMIHGEGLLLASDVPPGLLLPWDREDFLELLGNLLDNACKWADSEVRLGIAPSAEGYQLWSMTTVPASLRASASKCWSVVRGWTSRWTGMAWAWASCAISSTPGAGNWPWKRARWADCA